jgi:hypothetical protein
VPSYRSITTVTVQSRRAVYQGVAEFFQHLDAFDVNLLSLTYNATTQRIDIVTQNSIPAGQLAHLGIEES